MERDQKKRRDILILPEVCVNGIRDICAIRNQADGIKNSGYPTLSPKLHLM